ncbi:DUF882 domain-containing protein [Thermoproteota archaeon]
MSKEKREKKEKPRDKISEHFSKRDFACKCGVCEATIRIGLGLIGGLELLRTLAGQRITIKKGFVCPGSAESTSRHKKNYHTLGLAADITIDNKTLKEVVLLAEQVPEFKGIGLYPAEGYVHIDVRKEEKSYLWVWDGTRQIELTDENRSRYLD